MYILHGNACSRCGHPKAWRLKIASKTCKPHVEETNRGNRRRHTCPTSAASSNFRSCLLCMPIFCRKYENKLFLLPPPRNARIMSLFPFPKPFSIISWADIGILSEAGDLPRLRISTSAARRALFPNISDSDSDSDIFFGWLRFSLRHIFGQQESVKHRPSCHYWVNKCEALSPDTSMVLWSRSCRMQYQHRPFFF